MIDQRRPRRRTLGTSCNKIKIGNAGEQWVEDIENQERSRASCLGCLVFLMLVVSVLVVLEHFYDIF